jgi:hypothetical protein
MKPSINTGEKKMNDLLNKLKEVKKIYWIVGFFAVVVIANMLGYSGG